MQHIKVRNNQTAKIKPGDCPRGGKHPGIKEHRGTRVVEFFKVLAFCTGKEGPESYGKTMECLGLYVIAQFKNGSDVLKCLLNEKVIIPEEPEL